MRKHRLSRYGRGIGIFENTGDPSKDRLLLLAKHNCVEAGPGLGKYTDQLIDAIPGTLIIKAVNWAFNPDLI